VPAIELSISEKRAFAQFSAEIMLSIRRLHGPKTVDCQELVQRNSLGWVKASLNLIQSESPFLFYID